MAVNADLITLLRVYIQDTDSSTWNDTQLSQFLVLAAIEVSNELSVWGVPDFVIDITALTITPDPADSEDIISTLIVLKAACILTNSEIKKQTARAGYRIVDDKSTIDTTKVGENLVEVANNTCSMYDQAAAAFRRGAVEGGNNNQAVVPPYSQKTKVT